MTQALNLGLLGNNVNTSGQLSLTTGVSGTLPLANGGLGTTTLAANNVLLGNGGSTFQVVAPSTSGNILTSNGTTWTSAAPVGIAPTTAQALNAIAGATAAAVGTYRVDLRTTAPFTVGTTYAGSTVYSGGVGTWRCMGLSNTISFQTYQQVGCGANFVTVIIYAYQFLRIS